MAKSKRQFWIIVQGQSGNCFLHDGKNPPYNDDTKLKELGYISKEEAEKILYESGEWGY